MVDFKKRLEESTLVKKINDYKNELTNKGKNTLLKELTKKYNKFCDLYINTELIVKGRKAALIQLLDCLRSCAEELGKNDDFNSFNKCINELEGYKIPDDITIINKVAGVNLE